MRLLLLLLLAGCVVDNTISKDPGDPDFDSGTDPDSAGSETGDDVLDEEECNGVDDDGDGVVDEGYPDDDGNGRVDCLDETCPTLVAGVAGTVPVPEDCQGGGVVTPVDDP